MKRWVVKCYVNLSVDKELTVIVKANTERKARVLAMKHLHKEGYFAVTILSCNLMEEQKNDSSPDESSGV